ncbi:MAG: hypothetical protein Q9163_000413 [Psora crenata]
MSQCNGQVPVGGYAGPSCPDQTNCGKCYTVTNQGGMNGSPSGKGNMVIVQIIDACPATHAQNYCKTEIPENQRCRASGVNALDIDNAAYQSLTGAPFGSIGNLYIEISDVDCPTPGSSPGVLAASAGSPPQDTAAQATIDQSQSSTDTQTTPPATTTSPALTTAAAGGSTTATDPALLPGASQRSPDASQSSTQVEAMPPAIAMPTSDPSTPPPEGEGGNREQGGGQGGEGLELNEPNASLDSAQPSTTLPPIAQKYSCTGTSKKAKKKKVKRGLKVKGGLKAHVKRRH